jgi:hypothetical protein
MDRTGRHLALAPRKRELLGPLEVKKLTQSWRNLLSMEKTPANGIRTDITKCVEAEELKDLVRWTENVHERDFNLHSMAKKLAMSWLKKLRETNERTETQQDCAIVISELGDDVRGDAPAGTLENLEKLAAVAGFQLQNFWREFSIWLRRVFQLAFDWKIELAAEPKRLPAALFFTENASSLITELDGVNDVARRDIPAILEDTNSNASTWLLLKTDPVYFALVQIDDEAEDLTAQLWIWETISNTQTVNGDLRTLLRDWLNKTNAQTEPINGPAWQKVRNYLRPLRNEGNIRTVVQFHRNSVDQYVEENLREMMIRAYDDDIYRVRIKLRNFLGDKPVSDQWAKFHDIKILPKIDWIHKDFTNDLLRHKEINFAKNFVIRGVCAKKECERISGNFVYCNSCVTQITLISDERRGARLATLIRSPEKKVLARDRWTKAKILEDVHPNMRAPILRDIVKIQRTRIRHGGVTDVMAAIMAEKYESGCQKPWGHKAFRDNVNIVTALDHFTENYIELKKHAKWSSVSEVDEGQVILIPLRKIKQNGLRVYEQPIFVTIEEGAASAINLEDLPFQQTDKWVKARVNLPFTVPEFLSNLRTYGNLLDDSDEWPELVYMADFLRKTKSLNIAILMEEKKDFDKIIDNITEIVDGENRHEQGCIRYPQLISVKEVQQLETIIRFDGSTADVRTILRPQTKDMTMKLPQNLENEGEESIVNFLAHLTLSKKLVSGLHPENILGVSSWDQSESGIGASMIRQELSVAIIAMSLDHVERFKLSSWKLVDADLVFDTEQLKRHSEPTRSFIESLRTSDHPNGLQVLELVKTCEKVKRLAPVSCLLRATIRGYLNPDARYGKKITKKIVHIWNRFMLTGYLGRKRAIVPLMREYFQIRSQARKEDRPEELPQLYTRVPSRTWHWAQRDSDDFGCRDANGHFEIGSDSDCSDFSEGEDDRRDPTSMTKDYEEKLTNVQLRAERARERVNKKRKPENVKVNPKLLAEPEQEDEDDVSVTTEMFEDGSEITDWAEDHDLESTVDEAEMETDSAAALETSREHDDALPQSMKDKLRKLFEQGDENTQIAAAEYFNTLVRERREHQLPQEARAQNQAELERNPLYDAVVEEDPEEQERERERQATRAREQRYRRILCGEQDDQFVDWAEMMRAKNEARKYFAEQNLERKENGLEVRKTESEVSVASVELREYPVVGPENQEPTSTQECEQRQDRDMARQQLPLEHLEILDESTTESAITDTESSDTDDSDDVTVIINLETQAAEEAEIVEEAARAAALRIPEELTQDSTGLLKPYSGIPNENRDRGTNLEKLPKEL